MKPEGKKKKWSVNSWSKKNYLVRAPQVPPRGKYILHWQAFSFFPPYLQASQNFLVVKNGNLWKRSAHPVPSTGHLYGIGRGCFKWKLLSAWRRQNWRGEAFSFQQWLNFARVCIASLSVPCCGFLFLVWMLAIGNHDCSFSEQCFEWHSSGECWNIGEIIISSSCKTFFTPKDTEKPAQL